MDVQSMQRMLRRSQLNGAQGDRAISKDEANKLSKAFEDEKFRSMFQEYLKEISDPKHRNETEAYLRQLEGENCLPKNKRLLKPEPAFCIKTSLKNSESKVYINICSSKLVKAASPADVGKNNHNKMGTQWNIPYAVGKQRPTTDHRIVQFVNSLNSCTWLMYLQYPEGRPAIAVDVCFSPDTIAVGKSLNGFQNLIIETSKDASVKALDEKLNKTHKVLASKFKGGEPPMLMVDSANDATTAERKSNESALQSSVSDAERSACNAIRGKNDSNVITPKYSIIHRGQFNMSDHMQSNNREINNSISTKPKHLIINIELPLIDSVADAILDVSNDSVHFEVGKLYCLTIKLPHPVDSDHGKAKFVKEKRILVIEAPVTQE